MNKKYIVETPILNISDPTILSLIDERQWATLPEFERIGVVYDFVRNDIRFGYNSSDDLTASKILADGYGQCNTKATLLMALLRANNIACRLHGFTIDKCLQRGVVPELVYAIAPRNILHSWVDIYFEDKWINLEGFILDDDVLSALQEKFKDRSSLCGYGVGTNCLQAPDVGWTGADTYIQETGINEDFGLFDNPDAFYENHTQNFGFVRKYLYQLFIRHWMNRRVGAMRQGVIPRIPGGLESAPQRDFTIVSHNK